MRYVGAFDIGGTKTIIALADDSGKIYEKQQFRTETRDCFEHLAVCCDVFRKFLIRNGLESGEIAGIGVNLPGIVDREQGVLIRAVYAGWFDIPVKSFIGKELGIANVICENDVNSCAEAELRFGLGSKYKSFGWMTVSTGVGGAIVDNGKLIRGFHGCAGEFGHLKVEYENPERCPCGEYGCLEAQGSGTALNRIIESKVQQDEAFRHAFEEIGESPSGASCAALAHKGNKTAIRIFEEVGEYLGRGIAYYANILDPEAMVIGGGVSASLDLLMPGIRRSIERYTFTQMQNVEVIPTALGYEAALMGAIAIVKDKKEDVL